MKASELIKNLQYSIDEYGDLPVSISVARSKPELLDIIKKNIEAKGGSVIIGDVELYIGYDHRPEEDGGSDINIRNFPY